MSSVHTLVVGAGQAGLAVSHCLSDAGIDHVVLERGRLGERWRYERWDSLRLLSPNWATRLPGWSYRGPDPDGFMSAAELVGYFEAYARSFDAPVEEGSPVRSVERGPGGFVVRTHEATWQARDVVVATGWCDRPYVPDVAARLDRDVLQLTPSTYRNPTQVPDGRVLVVGASASGVQLADELARAGRDVVLSAGRHQRLFRRYRGRDIWWWLDRIGTFAKTIDQMPDAERARLEGSIPLVGHEDGRDVDLAALQSHGVHLVGRLVDGDGTSVAFADDLETSITEAEARLGRLLDDVDAHVDATGLAGRVPPPERPAPVTAPAPTGRLDLRREGISTVVWATGFTRSYPWLRVPVLGPTGEIAHDRGVTPVPGLYVLGQRFQHRRDSNFIDGVRHDAAFVARHIATRAGRRLAA